MHNQTSKRRLWTQTSRPISKESLSVGTKQICPLCAYKPIYRFKPFVSDNQLPRSSLGSSEETTETHRRTGGNTGKNRRIQERAGRNTGKRWPEYREAPDRIQKRIGQNTGKCCLSYRECREGMRGTHGRSTWNGGKEDREYRNTGKEYWFEWVNLWPFRLRL